MGLSYQQLGQLGAAEQAFNEAMEQGKMLGNVHIVASSFGHLAEVQIERGQLHEAAETCQRGLELLDALAGKSSPMAGLLHVQLGELFYEWNDLDTAVHHYQEGIALAQPWQNKETLLPGYSGLARAYLVAGHPQKAQTAQKALTALAASERPTNTGLLESQTEQADGDLLSLLDEAEMGERWGRVIKLRARQALRCEKMGDVATAIASLARAITLAEPEKYVRSFVDGGEAMERLLQMGMANGRLSSYAQNLLNAFRVTHDPQMSEVFETSDISRISENLTPATLIDPLSQRELEVLSLISEGLTNKEIALRLHLSVGTVKVHAHNIYGKLDVNGRTQAVAKGRALNLLS
jgi:LuxR family maltose regulon positive regulatory protein